MKLDLNSDDEKKLVDGVYWNAMDSLSDDDKKLPQVLYAIFLDFLSFKLVTPEVVAPSFTNAQDNIFTSTWMFIQEAFSCLMVFKYFP